MNETMKNISRILVAALAIMGVASCNTAPVEEANLGTTTITASLVQSRTTLADGVKTLWSADDAIEVNGVTFNLTEGAGQATATFASTTPLVAADSYTATYPAGVTAIPTAQSAVAGTFDPQAALATATGTSTENLLFEHNHALLKFGVEADAAAVEVLGYTLSGDMVAGQTYYLAVAADSYNGLVATVDGKVVKATEETVTVNNGTILNIGILPNAAAVEAKGIRTADDLIAFAAAVEAQIAAEQTPDGGEWKDENGVVNILADIDMTGKTWEMISNFSGILEGNNFTIDNLVHETNASSAAMFKNLSDATIQNLKFGKGCKFSASGKDSNSNTYVGTVVARIMAGATIKNVTTAATVSGGTLMGGICGAADLKKGNILFENCTNNGAVVYPAKELAANLVMGGFVGQSESKVSYVNCVNNANITNNSTGGNKYNKMGGIAGGTGDAVMTNCSNNGTLTINAKNANHIYAGGLVGCSYRGDYNNNTNNGGIVVTNDVVGGASMYIGGCFGSAEGNAAPTTGTHFNYYKCVNTASISVGKAVTKDTLLGGIVGLAYCVDTKWEECSNSGKIEMTKGGNNSAVGGIVGLYTKTNTAKPVNGSLVYNCTNTGEVIFNDKSNANWIHMGGVVGKTVDGTMVVIDGCTNRGNMTKTTASRANPGGIISESNCDVKNCVNYGTIYVTDTHVDYFSGAAGIVSRLNANKTVSGCKNYGTIIYNGKGFTKANTNKGIVGQGGIVALMNKGTVDNCENYGIILGNDYDASLGKQQYINAKGSIVGWAAVDAATTIKNCKVGGAIGSCVDTDQDLGASKAAAITNDNYADYVYGDKKNAVTVSGCTFAAIE